VVLLQWKRRLLSMGRLCILLSDKTRLPLLFLGLLTVSLGGLLVASASQTILIVADRELDRYWRTTYDILVRPVGARSPIEEKYGLVEANHLSGIWGGITFEQYETIRSIPGVEVAAPIAMLGYKVGVALGNEMPFPPFPGAYALDETATIDGGSRTYTPSGFPRRHYYYFDWNPWERPPGWEETYRYLGDLTVNHPSPTVNGTFWFPIFLAGIDPLQEAALTGLDQALLEGHYLTEDESLVPRVEFVPLPAYNAPDAQINLPVLINATTYISLSHHTELRRVILPQGMVTSEELLARGGTGYLNGLPSEIVAVATLDSQEMYQKMIESISSQSIFLGGWATVSIPDVLEYREATSPTHSGCVLEVQLPEDQADQEEVYYRRLRGAEFNASYMLDIKGIFDIENLPRPADVTRVPLETYFPPVAILRYDDQGRPVEPPRELRPTLNPAGYIQPPPLLLTTLQAARALRGEAAISAIRVRVALEGCSPRQPENCPITPAAQRKIETIAIEIQRQTGLDVDIMVGSSPRRILVRVPGIGYVEEQWIQKGVNLVYRQGIRSGHWLLLSALLFAEAFFTLDLVWAEVAARRHVIALQKALGWRSRTVFAQVVRQVVTTGIGAALTGAIGAWCVSRFLNWQSPSPGVLAGLPVAVTGLCVVSSILPAWLASRVPPITGIQHGGVRYCQRAGRAISGMWAYAWSEVTRRPVRTVLTGSVSAISAALLTLLLATSVQQRGLLGGTLLGEFILVHVEPFHYALVAIGLGLMSLSVVNGLLEGIIERRREIGILKAIGWRTGTVAWLFVMEGTLLGLVGGATGAMLGSMVLLWLYRTFTLLLAGVAALSMAVPGLVGALAALYPAGVAARVSPATVMRNE